MKREVLVVVILNKLEEQDEKIRSKIRKMERQYRKFRVVDFTDLAGGDMHAKVIVADRKKAIIGSANFSWPGMSHNYEMGVQLEGDYAWKLGNIIDGIENRFGKDVDRNIA